MRNTNASTPFIIKSFQRPVNASLLCCPLNPRRLIIIKTFIKPSKNTIVIATSRIPVGSRWAVY